MSALDGVPRPTLERDQGTRATRCVVPARTREQVQDFGLPLPDLCMAELLLQRVVRPI